MIMAFLLALGTVPIYAADASPMEVTFVNAPNGAEMASETATPAALAITPFVAEQFDIATGLPASGANWAFDGTILTVNDGANIIITGEVSGARRIVVNGDANITLDNASIIIATGYNSPLLLNSGANLTLTLEGTNTLTAGLRSAGIQAPDGTSLIINGTGAVTATGTDGGAGIGGGQGSDGGIIHIGGNVYVTAISTALPGFLSNGGAGIGGGDGGHGGSIVIIDNASVTAMGGNAGCSSYDLGGGAGIGGGGNSHIYYTSNGGNIVISTSGIVTAIGGNGAAAGYGGGGAGIGGGGGRNGGNSGNITITDSIVTATGGDAFANARGGAGIGSGGNITASCGENGSTFTGGPAPAIQWLPGEGAYAAPWEISTPAHLVWVRENHRNVTPDFNAPPPGDRHFRLQNSIDATGLGNDVMIGGDAEPFIGTFDGGGFVITVDIDVQNEMFVGLFRIVGIVGLVRGLGVAGNVTARRDTLDFTDAGGLAGGNWGTVERSFSSVNVYAPNGIGVGGLVGYNEGNVQNSYATGNVTGANEVGGLVGFSQAAVVPNISNSYATGNVMGVNDVGGVFGRSVTIPSNNVALSGNIVGNDPGRGVGGVSLDVFNLHASAAVRINGAILPEPAPPFDTFQRHGRTATPAQIATQAWWAGASPDGLGFNFDPATGAWEWCDTANLPILRGFNAPQNPRAPGFNVIHLDFVPNPPSGEGWTFNLTSQEFTIEHGADVIVTGNNAGSERRVAIAADATATVTLADATIAGLFGGNPAINLNSGATLNLNLTSTSTLAGAINAAGILVPPPAQRLTSTATAR